MQVPTPDAEMLDAIPGAARLIEWFGGWPSFHDAEVLELCLRRRGESRIRVHAWTLTDKLNERGGYVTDRDAVVTFVLDNVHDLDLHDFSCQNVLGAAGVERTQGGFRVVLAPCFGVAGTIEAEQLRIELLPGAPSD